MRFSVAALLLLWSSSICMTNAFNLQQHRQQRQQHQQHKLDTVLSSSSSLSSSALSALSAVDADVAAANKNSDGDDDNDKNDTIEFPPPLSAIDRVKRAATFWSTALPIVANYYGLDARFKLQSLLNNGTPTMSEAEQEALWKALHADGATKLADTIANLKGFYVKTAQIISSRRDLFPEEYTDALSGFTDNLDPMPAALAKAVVCAELLNADETFEDVFVEFDDVPLGAASVAQVHRAVLSEKYGGREVAVKIQRPSIESKLLGDIANLKSLAKTFRNNPALPLDYYTVFSELEVQLQDEFDFVKEAVAMDRIYNACKTAPDGTPREIPLVIPRPVPGLVSKRVMVQDFLRGVPLSRAKEEMERKGIDPNSPQAKLFGRNLLSALTTVFGRTILETGFFHADPHPGNIFVLDDGRIGLIDYGQVKQISGRARETLCKVMIALDERDEAQTGKLALELNVELNENAKPEAPAAVAIWLFDGSFEELPGGYDMGELSPNSPVKELKSFPQDLVLVGRSSVLIKGLSNRLNIPWSLAKEWAPIARQVLDQSYKNPEDLKREQQKGDGRVRFREVMSTMKLWSKGRATRFVRKLPPSVQTKVLNYIVKREERKSEKALMAKK